VDAPTVLLVVLPSGSLGTNVLHFAAVGVGTPGPVRALTAQRVRPTGFSDCRLWGSGGTALIKDAMAEGGGRYHGQGFEDGRGGSSSYADHG
jgi:hypothetical protein